ncbi:hybrid sensor histidine kinase/response regulator [Desulfosarcina ovata subsp. sediminis]|uniref:histidine kinase n=1 Tax=Desulfosarcina ovata subsp. sediminis TaxID=885957 RepID=A0A5K7ZPM6_9BACT|nr:hybrid sensor histidine kinase/response regulator [Desulfosarcina ovata]BBO82905.1 hybrid sensor histidine kinase/response regulator [Desulfosarcina ovata subsp. sediminis]
MDKQRILIVDDTPENIRLLSDLLKPIYNVSAATNGPDALEIAASEEGPDLILLDIMMPGMDGYEVCRKLQSNSKTDRIPVIFVTAKDQVDDETKGFSLGCVDYIKKPISPMIAHARIKSHLALTHALETMESQNNQLKAAAKLREDVERISRHDLKNPLTAILSGAQLLEIIGGLNKNQANALNIIKDSAYRMVDMINSSLDLFKIEQGIYRPKVVDVDMIDIVQRIEQGFRTLIRLKKTRLSLRLQGRPLDGEKTFIVKGEPLLLHSMMANLIKNSVEAVPKNEAISIFFSFENNSGVIRIHNQGSVPEGIRDTFFDKYSTAGKKNGTGIGTYSAKLIVEMLGGSIRMTSSESQGTTIFIHLPMST